MTAPQHHTPEAAGKDVAFPQPPVDILSLQIWEIGQSRRDASDAVESNSEAALFLPLMRSLGRLAAYRFEAKRQGGAE